MNPLRLLFALVLVLSVSADAAFAQTTARKTATPRVGGVIAGRVTVHGKGLPGVIVSLRAGGPQAQGQTPQATTDADGKYRITDVPLGSYVVMPVAPAYTVPGATRMTAPTDEVVITNNDTIEDIDFELVRGGVVTGKVSDTDGRPIIDQPVALQNLDQNQQRGGFGPSPVAMGSFRTDDRGVYRIYGVPAGKYVISIGAQQRLSAFATVNGQQAYKQTFHPDTGDQSQATTFEVAEGAEVSNIDITVGRTLDEYSASGVVVDSSTNGPVPNVGFSLSIIAGGGNRQRAMGLMSLPIVSDSSGQFRIDNLPAGRYQVSVAPQSGAGLFGQSAPFDVINQDVTGIQISAVQGASLSGVVGLDTNQQQDPLLLGELMQFQVQVFVQANGGRGFGGAEMAASAQTVPINPDGTFQVNGLPAGTARLQLVAQDPSLQGAFKLLRVERTGAVQNRGVTVKSGDNITDVRLVAAYADATISGQVKFQNGPLQPGAWVSASLSAVGQGQGRGIRNGGMADVDDRGRFVIQNVPAGAYTLVVTANLPGQGGGRGRGGRSRITAQQTVNAIEGQIANVAVTLDLGQTPPNPTP